MTAAEAAARVAAALRAAGDPVRAEQMARYMKGASAFAGVPTPQRRAIAKIALDGWRPASADELALFARVLWAEAERECCYVAADELRRHHRVATLGLCEELITTRSWWDSVDPLTVTVGRLFLRDPAVVAAMDRWIEDENIWRIRTALICQLGHKGETDTERLFRYCAHQARHREFFVRKAIGWALRDYARTDPEAVRAFVAAHPELSPLSVREATKHLGGTD